MIHAPLNRVLLTLVIVDVFGRGRESLPLRQRPINPLSYSKFAVAAAEVTARWDALAVEPGRLTPFRKVAVSGEYHR